MHPDLSAHLHTAECNVIIKAYKQCHIDFPFRKFLGQCNDLDRAMNKCLKRERLAKRAKNQEHAKMMREKILNYNPEKDEDL